MSASAAAPAAPATQARALTFVGPPTAPTPAAAKGYALVSAVVVPPAGLFPGCCGAAGAAPRPLSAPRAPLIPQPSRGGARR